MDVFAVKGSLTRTFHKVLTENAWYRNEIICGIEMISAWVCHLGMAISAAVNMQQSGVAVTEQQRKSEILGNS